MLNESLCITWIINFISWNQINLLHIQRTIDNTTPYDWLAKNDPHACSWSASCCTPETRDAISCIDLFWCWAYASSVWYKDDCTWVSWNYVLSHWLLILNPNLLKKCMCQIVKSLSLGQGRFQGGGHRAIPLPNLQRFCDYSDIVPIRGEGVGQNPYNITNYYRDIHLWKEGGGGPKPEFPTIICWMLPSSAPAQAPTLVGGWGGYILN